MDSAAQINRVLRALRARLSATMFLRHTARGTLFFFAILVVLRAAVWWQGGSRPDPSGLPYMLTWPFALGAIGAAILTALRRPSLSCTAAIVDARAGTRDRLLSAREFSALPKPTEMQRLAVNESARWLTGKDLRPYAAIEFPRELRWIAVPLATLALLWWHETDRANQRDARIAEARENVSPTVESLEAMAKEVEQRAAATDDEKLRKVAERLKESAKQLRAEAEKGGDTNTAALRQIADLEQLVKQLRQPQRATPDELKSLAQALTQNEATKEAGKALEENRPADAAQALEQAAKSPEAEKAEAELQAAVDHLAQRQEQTSKQLEQLQQQMAQAGGERGEMLQKLAQMLREMPAAPKPGEEGKEGAKKADKKGQQGDQQMSDDDLKKLLSALEQLKDQQQPGEEQGEGGEPGEKSEEGSGPVTMLSFQQSPNPDPSSQIGVPSGKPGDEKDSGTTKDPFAKKPGEAGEPERQEPLKGQLGEGESLSLLVPSASAGEAKATRRYKELTEAAAAQAADAVTQEDIPLGARFLIKRYFDAIRPRE